MNRKGERYEIIYVVDKLPDGIWVAKPSTNIDENKFHFLFYTDKKLSTFAGISKIEILDTSDINNNNIETYIEKHVGVNEDGGGNIYFNRTLNDWAKFDINKRTKFDATISSGLAIMACNRHLYHPKPKYEKSNLDLKISRYNNKGTHSQIIQ